MLELYEQNRVPPSQTSEVLDGSTGGGVTQKPRALAVDKEHGTHDSDSYVGAATSRSRASNPASSRPSSNQLYQDNCSGRPRTSQDQSNDDGSTDRNKDINSDVENNDDKHYDSKHHDGGEAEADSSYGVDGHAEGTGEVKEKYCAQNLNYRSESPLDAIRKIDKDKVRAALEKQRKARGRDLTRRTDLMDEDDLIERELEDGIELAAESEKSKLERKHDRSNSSNHTDNELEQDYEPVEEGEVGVFEEGDKKQWSPRAGNRKRKASGSPPTDKRRRN